MTTTTTIRLDVPALDPGETEGHAQRYFGGRLSLAQGRALKRLTAALTASHARLANGRHVEDGAGAVRWLLERYAAEGEG